MPVSTFESEVKEYYERKRRSHLTNQIGTAAKLMRETLLLCAVYDEVFDGTISPDTELRKQVGTLQRHVTNNEFDQIEDDLEETLSGLQSERDDARETLQIDLHDIEDRITGFKSLNRRIDEIGADRIEGLSETIQNLDDVPAERGVDYVQLEEQVRENARQFVEELEAVEEELFKGFRGSDIEEQVRSLLEGEQLHLNSAQDEELIALKESQLGAYVTLSLEGK